MLLACIGLWIFIGITNTKNADIKTNSPSLSEKKYMNINCQKYCAFDAHIVYLPDLGSYRKTVKLQKENDIKGAVQFFNELQITPLENGYQYQGGDSPVAWIYLYYDRLNKNNVDKIYFYEDLDHSIIIRSYIDSEYKYYKIDTIEYEKLKSFFESYDH